MDTTQTKGLKRNTIDKYYTKPNVVNNCIDLIKTHLNITKDDFIIEPSAGDGAFIPSIKQLTNHFKFYDLEPEHNDIIHSPSDNHREFTNDPMGCGNTWNVLCYYKNINCNLYNSGLGIIYKSNDIDKDNNYIIKRVALPVINGLTLKIRDCYFFHFTPPPFIVNIITTNIKCCKSFINF